jgi:ParB-like chromosome segregation protein Spo0J
MHAINAPLDRLRDAPRNANKMPPARYKLLVESIRKIGFVQHALVRDLGDGELEIVDGHNRAKALRELGETEMPSLLLQGSEDPRVVALALNRIRGETDLAVAALVIEELLSEAFSYETLAIAAFSEKEIEALVEAVKNTDDPDLSDLASATVPEEIGTPTARPYLLDLTFRTKDDLAACRKALKKAAGKGADLADGLLRLVRGET